LRDNEPVKCQLYSNLAIEVLVSIWARRRTGNGSIDLSILAADGSTYAPITNVNFALASQVANGSRIYDLSGGTYSFQVVGTVSGAYASIAPAQA
jgi:hypothetical protein